MYRITPIQKKVGAYIMEYRALNVQSPTITMIALRFKKDRKTIYSHLKRMEAKGYLNKLTPTARLKREFKIY